MFRIVIDMENLAPPLSRTGPDTINTQTYVSTFEEAHRALDVVLEAMGIEESEPEYPGRPV